MAEKVKSWRSSPGFGRCKDVADCTGAEMVIVYELFDTGEIKAYSYGRTRESCDAAGELLDAGMKAIIAEAGR
jgi:hypothetical protein